jgi:hypothetical protein
MTYAARTAIIRQADMPDEVLADAYADYLTEWGEYDPALDVDGTDRPMTYDEWENVSYSDVRCRWENSHD